MKRRAIAALSAIVLAAIFLAGCAVPVGNGASNDDQRPVWRGRLAVRVGSDQAQSAPQAFAAGFELTGDARAGVLMLYTPMGTTAAAMTWSAQEASMRTNGEVRFFSSLDEMIKQAVGTEIPVDALFAWLAGDNMSAAGWRADLSQLADGRITARRTDPPPLTELRLALEK